MPKINNTLTGAAGEHLVAAQLSIRGYSVGLTRGGSKAVDLLASNADGSRSVAVQVKSSYAAWHEMKKKEQSLWQFMLSTSDIQKRASELIYVLVSLDGFSVDAPEYLIIPSSIVSQRLEEKYRGRNRTTQIRMLDIYEHEEKSFLNRWDIIEDALK